MRLIKYVKGYIENFNYGIKFRETDELFIVLVEDVKVWY